MPVDAAPASYHMAQAVETRPLSGGTVFVAPVAPGAVRPPQAATLSVTATGATIGEARQSALAEARREAAARGLPGAPRVKAESFSGGQYSALVEFPDPPAGAASPYAPGAIQATPLDGPMPLADQAAPAPRGKPAWVLVIPVEVGRGGKVVWGREAEWTRAWLVPARHAGMRLVATMGDADDHDRLTAALLAEPASDRTAAAARALARKYSAPAVALLRYDAGDAAVDGWLWRADGGATNAEAELPAGAPVAAGRERALGLLAELAATEDAAVPAPDAGADSGLPARLTVTGPGAQGAVEFLLEVDSADPEEQRAARRALRELSGVVLKSVRPTPDGLEMSGSWFGDASQLARLLATAGLRVSR